MRKYYGLEIQMWAWCLGFAHLMDGISVLLTLGFFDPGLSSICYQNILKSMFRHYERKKANEK